MILTCKVHNEPLLLVSRTPSERLAVCPVCGAGWHAKAVIEESSGMIAGLLSEKELVGLREQARVAQEKGIAPLVAF